MFHCLQCVVMFVVMVVKVFFYLYKENYMLCLYPKLECFIVYILLLWLLLLVLLYIKSFSFRPFIEFQNQRLCCLCIFLVCRYFLNASELHISLLKCTQSYPPTWSSTVTLTWPMYPCAIGQCCVVVVITWWNSTQDVFLAVITWWNYAKDAIINIANKHND